MLVEPCLRRVHRLIGELGLPFDVDALALRAVELLGQRLLQRVEFGELGIVPDRGDGAFDVGDRRLRAVLVDLLPCGVCELVGEFALSLQAVGLFLRARVRLRGLVALALRVLDARAQLRQIAFVDESDDLLTVLDAMLAAFAGFDLPVGLHLPHGMVGVVDAVDAQGVETLGAGLLAQPAGERGILAVAQLRGQPHLSVRPAGRTRVRAAGPAPGSPAFGVDELPGAPRHGVRVDGADLGCESTLMALVDEDGLGHGSVCGVHGEAPMLLILAHVHELRDVRQFARAQPGGPAQHGAGLVHLAGDAGALRFLAFVIVVQPLQRLLDGRVRGVCLVAHVVQQSLALLI